MSSSFKKFGEAARLYAQYSQVVDEIEELFVRDLLAFLDAVKERMQAKLDEGRIEERITKEYLSWWIEDDETRDEEDVPYVWMERKSAEIVTPGVLRIIADFDEANDGEKRQLSALKSSVKLPSHCKWLEKRLFAVAIHYGDADPVEAASEPLLAILTALHRVEKQIFAARNAKKK